MEDAMVRRKLVFRPPSSVLRHPSFADLVVIARSLYPIPSRTRPSKSSAPTVLSLKAWKSMSPPGLPRTEHPLSRYFRSKAPRFSAGLFLSGVMCSSRDLHPFLSEKATLRLLLIYLVSDSGKLTC